MAVVERTEELTEEALTEGREERTGRRRLDARIGFLATLCAAALIGACSGGDESPAPQTPEVPAAATQPLPTDVSAPGALGTEEMTEAQAAGEFNDPPADIEQEKSQMVRCLVDSPPGCDGCGRGETCVYEQMNAYDCVYVIYGTACTD